MLTKIPNHPNSADVVPGMAFYRGTGPAGKTCGDCVMRQHLGKGRLFQCAMFKRLTGMVGQAIRASNLACKYFEQRPK